MNNPELETLMGEAVQYHALPMGSHLEVFESDMVPSESTPQDRILELGSAWGWFSLFLIGVGYERIVSIDLSLPMLKIAHAVFARWAPAWAADLAPFWPSLETYSLDRLNLSGADATKLPFADQSFDKVYGRAIISLDMPWARPQALQESLRVLRPGGRLLLYEDHLPPMSKPYMSQWFWTIDQWRASLQEASFEIEVCEDVQGGLLIRARRPPAPIDHIEPTVSRTAA